MDFGNMTEIIVKEIKKESIIRYREVKTLCTYPYVGHRYGCPNVKKCEKIPFIEEIKEFNGNKFFLLIARFDFRKYKYLRFNEHPDWSGKKIRCVLYWQSSIKKILKNEIEKFKKDRIYVLGCGSGFKLSFQEKVYSMESVGINVFSTLKLNGIKFEVKPKNFVNLCCLIIIK